MRVPPKRAERGELVLDDLPADSPLEMVSFLGQLRGPGQELAGIRKAGEDTWMKVGGVCAMNALNFFLGSLFCGGDGRWGKGVGDWVGGWGGPIQAWSLRGL